MDTMSPDVAYTRTLSDYALDLDLKSVPDDVKHEARRILLDCIGCAVAGRVTPAGRIAIDLAKDEHGPNEATVIGGSRASIMPAVFANTVLTNAIDYDIYGPEGHVAPVAVPAALAAAEATNASGADLFAAIIAAMELGGRVGGALRRPGMGGGQSLGQVRGHGHVIFAAVTAAGRLFGLNHEQMHNAFGIAGYGATVPTLRKFFASPYGPMTKYDHLGAMTQNGVQAALLAQRGFTGDLEVLEGDIGFWRFAGAQGCDWDHLVHDLGTEWTIREVSYKPFPVSLYTNPGIVLARKMAREHGLRPEDIDSMEVRTSRAGDTPGRKDLRHSIDAWNNAFYTMACGLFDIRPHRSWQEPVNYQRADLAAYMDKVTFTRVREAELTTKGNYWERWSPVRITITAKGQQFEGSEDYLPMMTDEEVTAKFHENVAGFLSQSDAEQLAKRCWGVDELASARELTEVIRG